MRTRKLNRFELEQSWQQWTMGRTTTKVAETYNIKKASLIRQWRAAGFPFRAIRRKVPPADKKLRELTKLTGLDQGQVMYTCLLMLGDRGLTHEHIVERWKQAVEMNEIPPPAYAERRYDYAGPFEKGHK